MDAKVSIKTKTKTKTMPVQNLFRYISFKEGGATSKEIILVPSVRVNFYI